MDKKWVVWFWWMFLTRAILLVCRKGQRVLLGRTSFWFPQDRTLLALLPALQPCSPLLSRHIALPTFAVWGPCSASVLGPCWCRAQAKLPFFVYAAVAPDLIVGRGRSGGLALWAPADVEWAARTGVLQVGFVGVAVFLRMTAP